MTKLIRLGLIVLCNVVVFLVLVGLLELTYRIHRDGLRDTFINIVKHSQAPYSNLGTSNWVIYDEELGYRLNPNQTDINSLSVRHGEIAIPKPRGLYRILFLGDSIPWDRPGFVSDIGGQLMTAGAYEVINASVPGYTSYQELLFFKRYLVRTDPDLVIWTYCLNDNHRFLHRFDEKARMLVTPEAEQGLRINSVGDTIISRSYLLSVLRLRLMSRTQQEAQRYPWENAIDFNIAWKDFSWELYEQHLGEMTRLLSTRNIKLAVVIFPYEPQLKYRHDTTEHDYIVKPQRMLIALCKKYGVTCLDLYPVFSEAYDEGKKLYRDGIHLNETGHRIAASTIFNFIGNHSLIPAVRGTVNGG